MFKLFFSLQNLSRIVAAHPTPEVPGCSVKTLMNVFRPGGDHTPPCSSPKDVTVKVGRLHNFLPELEMTLFSVLLCAAGGGDLVKPETSYHQEEMLSSKTSDDIRLSVSWGDLAGSSHSDPKASEKLRKCTEKARVHGKRLKVEHRTV